MNCPRSEYHRKDMITTTEIGQRFGAFGEAILDELVRVDWSQPMQASVEELGLAMGSHIGLKRKRNEDRIAVGRIQSLSSEIYTVAIVCDGVGGSESGDRAATLAITTVLGELSTQSSWRVLADLAAHVVRCADEVVRKELGGRGTTTLCMFLTSNAGKAACVSVGDSRAYSWGDDADVFQISIDDTVENELKGLPGNHDALLNARGLKERLSQAIGEADRSAADLRIRLHSHENFPFGVLLGSDGMWKVAKDFHSIMRNSRTAIDAVRRGINSANWVGGVDNASLIAIDDLKKFCGIAYKQDLQKYCFSLTLWIGSSKVKFLGDRGSKKSEIGGPEKAKKRPSKIKKMTLDNSELQMEIPVATKISQETRPVIEVTIDPSEKK